MCTPDNVERWQTVMGQMCISDICTDVLVEAMSQVVRLLAYQDGKSWGSERCGLLQACQ